MQQRLLEYKSSARCGAPPERVLPHSPPPTSRVGGQQRGVVLRLDNSLNLRSECA